MEDLCRDDPPEACLRNIIYQESLKWIFVGGKGGCGKTSVSCGLAMRLAEVRETVLLLSIDPAHNISDAFGQRFTKAPTKVKGFDNLFAMEVDTDDNDENQTFFGPDDESDTVRLSNSFMKSILLAFPGINDTMSYGKIMKLVESMNFTVIVIDTASSGHTIRLLTLPLTMEKALGKMLELKNRIGPYLYQISMLFGPGIDLDDIGRKIEEWLDYFKTLNQQLKDPEKTTFICVCIAEFLSLYETERLIQELNKNEIDSHNIVVNHLYTNNRASRTNCKKCLKRKELQRNYLDQIRDLYFNFHLTKVPLLEKEVRGAADLNEFSNYLMFPNYNYHMID